MKTKPIHLLLLLPMMSGCASIERSTLLGAASVGALGTGVGIANERSVGSALIGLGIGAIVGGALGFAAHKDQESKRGQLLNPVLTKDFKDKVPAISTPEVRRVWVPEKIDGNKYIDGHYIYVIDRQAVWGK
jgi:hypothetical protein